MPEDSIVANSRIARHVLAFGVLLALFGAVVTLALSAGSPIERPIARVGAIITIAGLAVVFIVTPVAFLLTIGAIRQRLSHLMSRFSSHRS